MAEYHVVPDGNTWKVTTGNGATVSTNHRKKSAAKRAMDRAANRGDSKYIHNRNGRIIEENTHRG